MRMPPVAAEMYSAARPETAIGIAPETYLEAAMGIPFEMYLVLL